MEESLDEELTELRKQRLQKLTGGGPENTKMRFPGEPVHVNDASFQNFITGFPLVVVDCWAPWCGPCRTLAPIFEALAMSYRGKIVFGKLNVDDNPNTARAYQTMSIPTLLIFKEGKLIDRIVGALPRQVIEQKLQMHLNPGGYHE